MRAYSCVGCLVQNVSTYVLKAGYFLIHKYIGLFWELLIFRASYLNLCSQKSLPDLYSNAHIQFRYLHVCIQG